MGIHFDPRGETVTIHRRTFLAQTAATSIDTPAIRGCVGAIDRLARDVPLGTEARQSLNDYASIQTSIGTGAPDVLGQFLGLNEVVLTGSQDTSTHQGRFQIVTLTLRHAIDDNHTWAETIPSSWRSRDLISKTSSSPQPMTSAHCQSLFAKRSLHHKKTFTAANSPIQHRQLPNFTRWRREPIRS